MSTIEFQSRERRKSEGELALLRKAGLANWRAHREAERRIRPGVATAELNAVVAASLRTSGAEPLFLGAPGADGRRFPAESCISVNAEALHAIPGDEPLKAGDVVSIDIGCRLGGWCADSAETHLVLPAAPAAIHLVAAARELLCFAIQKLRNARRWSDVVAEVDRVMSGSPWKLIPGVFGHGIGRDMHESPQVALCRTDALAPFVDFDLVTGTVFTIEPVLTGGSGALRIADDGWTLCTADGAEAAHFEHTIAITEVGPLVLTGPP